MKQKYLTLLMLPIMCTALSACDNGDVSTIISNGDSTPSTSSTEETSSEVSSDVISDTSGESTSITEEKTETQKIVTKVLDAYRDDDIVGKMFAGSSAMAANLDMNLDATMEDTKLDHSKVDIEMGVKSGINVNTYVDDTNEEVPVKIYETSDVEGNINYAADIPVEDEETGEITSYEPSHLTTDMDIDEKAEVSDQTYVTVEGKVPDTDIHADSEEFVETSEDAASRANTDFKGYLNMNYSGWRSTAGLLLSLLEDEETSEEQDITDILDINLDLTDEEAYNNIYEMLTSEDDNPFITQTVSESTEGYTFDFGLNIDWIDALSFLTGETVGAQLSSALGLEGENAIDYATIKRNNSNSNKVDFTVELGADFLIKNVSLDLNLDGVDIEVREYEEVDKDTTTEAPVVVEDYIVNFDEFNITFDGDFSYGDVVLEKGFSEEEKTDILENGVDLAEIFSDIVSAPTEE